MRDGKPMGSYIFAQGSENLAQVAKASADHERTQVCVSLSQDSSPETAAEVLS